MWGWRARGAVGMRPWPACPTGSAKRYHACLAGRGNPLYDLITEPPSTGPSCLSLAAFTALKSFNFQKR